MIASGGGILIGGIFLLGAILKPAIPIGADRQAEASRSSTDRWPSGSLDTRKMVPDSVR